MKTLCGRIKMMHCSMHLYSGSPSVTIIDNGRVVFDRALNYPKTKPEMVTEVERIKFNKG